LVWRQKEKENRSLSENVTQRGMRREKEVEVHIGIKGAIAQGGGAEPEKGD